MSEDCAVDFSTITDYAKYEMRGVIWYLLKEDLSAADIHHRLVVAYSIDVMNRKDEEEWVCEFKDMRTNVHDKDR